jgi:hypothetical protein
MLRRVFLDLRSSNSRKDTNEANSVTASRERKLSNEVSFTGGLSPSLKGCIFKDKLFYMRIQKIKLYPSIWPFDLYIQEITLNKSQSMYAVKHLLNTIYKFSFTIHYHVLSET